MGGRGRETQRERKIEIDRWAWVQELSDVRLENYGKMSSYQPESDLGKTALNWACAKEFERRTGDAPSWKR